jgi:hypothetical protein
MWRYVIALVIMGAGLNAELSRAPLDVSKIDPGIGYSKGTHASINYNPTNITIVLVDSAVNQYGMWTNMQDPIVASGDTVIFFNRRMGDNTLGSGAVGIIWTTDDFTSHISDWPVNDGLTNDPHPGDYLGRYPTAVYHPTYPAASWPELTTVPAWGYVGVGNEPDYSTTGFYGIFSDDIQVHKAISKTRDDNLIVGLAPDINNNNYYFIYDPDLGEFNTTPTLVPILSGFDLYQVDYYNGFMAFGWFNGWAYSTSSDGTSWSSPTVLSPSGMPTGGTMWWMDGAIGFDGTTPFIVTDFNQNLTADTLHGNEVWFMTPDFAVRIDVGMDTYNHYAQLVLDRESQVIYVVWAEASSNTQDPTIEGYWWDIYWSYSDDGGQTWSTPENLTQTPDVNECMPQVSRTLGSGKIWLVYATALDGGNCDLYNGVMYSTGCDVTSLHYHIGYIPVTGISEEEMEKPETELAINILRHLRKMEVSFLVKKAGNVEVVVYDISGRVVLEKSGTFGEGTHKVTFNTGRLATGYYFVRVVTPVSTKTAKVLIVN